MSFDVNLPANLEQAVDRYAEAEHLTREDATAKLIEEGLKVRVASALSARKPKNGVGASRSPVRQRKPHAVPPLSEEELNALKHLQAQGGTFGMLADVPDETLRKLEGSIRKMKRERFPSRG